MIVSDRLVESFDDIMDYGFTANFETQLDDIANGTKDWITVLNSYYEAFQDDLKNASDPEMGMRGNICRCGTYNRIKAAIKTASKM